MVLEFNESIMEEPVTKLSATKKRKNGDEPVEISFQDAINTEDIILNEIPHKRSKKNNLSIATTSDENSMSKHGSNDIDQDDLKQLLSAYRKCKAIVNKIESKYGHLLTIKDKEISDSSENENFLIQGKENEIEEQCNCKMNTKIVFDDMGNEIVTDNSGSQHICANYKLKKCTKVDNDTVKLEYEQEDTLPDDIQSLCKILKHANIDKVCRSSVLKKIRSIQQERKNEFRFQKPALIAQLKSNPHGLIGFVGTNLFDLSGYGCQ